MAQANTSTRLVRCPKCQAILPELPDSPLYKCGSCGTVLQAKGKGVSDGGPLESQHSSSEKNCRFQGCLKGARGASGLCIAHGGGRRCQRPGCNKGAEGRTSFCKAHGGGRRCEHLGCTKSAEGRTDFCIAHGGGRHCSHEGCNKAARGKSGLCIQHGGGKRCRVENCTKSAEGLSGLCISHGGGRRCQFLGCNKGAKESTTFCLAHGGGKKCFFPGCTKSARGRTSFCVRHGGGKRCKFDGCEKSAQGSTDFCKAHGGGKRCSWGNPGSEFGQNADRCYSFARGKTGLCAAHGGLVQDKRVQGSPTVVKDSEAEQPAEMKKILTFDDMKFDFAEMGDSIVTSSSSLKYFSHEPLQLSLGIGPQLAEPQSPQSEKSNLIGQEEEEEGGDEGEDEGEEEEEDEGEDSEEEEWRLQGGDKNAELGSLAFRQDQKRPFSALSSASLSREPDIALSYGEEQTSPNKKKPKISLDDQKSIFCVSEGDDMITLPGESSTDQRPVYSFHNLPEHVKIKCIRHCSLFPRDLEFERDKLVQLWIAEECIDVELSQRLEDVATSYFDALVNEELIITSAFDSLYGEMKYKVNTSKPSTWFPTQGDYLRIDEGKSDEFRAALHLSFHCKIIDRTIYDSLKKFKQLRTLVLSHCGSSVKQLPNDLFVGLKLLRTLDLSFTYVSDVPNSIGNLESLRYLDLSETPIKLLPESMDRLNLLQTLRLKGCFGVHALPKELRKLINLRHLDLDIVGQLNCMPKGMGSLKKLQTLRAFLVGKNDGCGIGELKNMNDITGSLCISRLENVANADEAKEAAIYEKKHIDKLKLRWCDHEIENPQIQVEILEYLQPHFGLKELEILFYSGSELPSWISNPLFTDLASITLYKCINCHALPSIGALRSLKYLTIVEMNSVRDISSLFCRTHGTQNLCAFPSLEKLTLDSMLNLETWTGLEDGDFPCLRDISIRYCPKLSTLPSFSRLSSLQHLEISHCMELISLPNGGFPCSLESLIIRDCPKINERCLKDGGEDWFKIENVKSIWIDFEEISLHE